MAQFSILFCGIHTTVHYWQPKGGGGMADGTMAPPKYAPVHDNTPLI